MGLHIMIMAGGAGVRFWPRSRAARPKQLLSIVGERSMLQQTVLRVLPLAPDSLLVVTNRLQAVDSIAQLEDLRSDLSGELAELAGRARVVAEPEARNTAPAVALAAALIAREDPDGTMVVLAADHHISREDIFRDVVRSAAAAAQGGSLVTLGIHPTRAETGYGYIELGDPVSEGVWRVVRFREKPDLETAIAYVRSGRYAWNSGMFVWRVESILAALERHMPELYDGALGVVDAPAGRLQGAIEELFRTAPKTSIDYGVMEPHDDVVVLPAEIGWSDVGSWASVAELTPVDGDGNASRGDVVFVDARRCFVDASRRTVALVGMRDCVVVETDDAVLVCKLERCQDVRAVVEELLRRGRTELT